MSDNLRSAKFAVLDRVEKPVGYRYPGIVRSVYAKGDGEIRYDVEADHPDFAGMLHIFSEAQLTHRRAAPAPEAKDDGEIVEAMARVVYDGPEAWEDLPPLYREGVLAQQRATLAAARQHIEREARAKVLGETASHGSGGTAPGSRRSRRRS